MSQDHDPDDVTPSAAEQPYACTAAAELADLHEMLGQQCADMGSRTDARKHMTIARTIRQLRTALIDANNLCRSAASVAARNGRATNWKPFRDRLDESLKRQHGVMYPETSPHNTSRRSRR